MRELRPKPILTREILEKLGESLRATYGDVETGTTPDQSELLQRFERGEGTEQGREFDSDR